MYFSFVDHAIFSHNGANCTESNDGANVSTSLSDSCTEGEVAVYLSRLVFWPFECVHVSISAALIIKL